MCIRFGVVCFILLNLWFDQGHRHGRQAEANHWLPDQNNAGAAQFPGRAFIIFHDVSRLHECLGHVLNSVADFEFA